MDSALYDDIKKLMRGKVRENEPMALHTSFGIGGPADIWAAPKTRKELFGLLDFCEKGSIPYMIIGRGTNLLIHDGGIGGVVISLEEACSDLTVKEACIRAGAAASLNALARFSADHGLKGLEFCAGIPGCVGGGLAVNAGSWGHNLCNAVGSALVYETRAGEVRNVCSDEIISGYRQSNLAEFGVILEAEFKLRNDDPAAITARIKEYLFKRAESQPVGQKSAGCIFRNPPEGQAGALIDALGFKGHTRGGALVSDIHANFIVNTGSATAADVLAIVAEIKERVRNASGIVLEEEIEVVGRN